MFDASTTARDAALAAIAAGWSLTLRDLESGSYGNDEASGYRHATVKMANGAYALLNNDGGWDAIDALARIPLTYGRRHRLRLARALVAWLCDGSTPDEPMRWQLTGEGSCEVCSRPLTASVARGFNVGPYCGGRVQPTLSERRGWGLGLDALLARAGKATPAPLPTPRCDGRCAVDAYCPDCDA